jgi:protein-tyrosine phosphatase
MSQSGGPVIPRLLQTMIEDFHDRHHRFDACFNFRDIGGYPTVDGRSVRWGRYYRAGRQDRMTAADLEKLRLLGIRSQVDLRRPDEVAEQGRGPLAALGVEYHHIPVIPEGGSERLNQLVGDTRISGRRYLGYLEFGPRSWIDLFELLADTDRHPILLHCTAGKDRTGVSTAFLLAVLGVDRRWIEADYVLTNRDVARQVDFLEQTGALPEGMDRQTMMHLAGIPAEAMGDFLDGVEARWGGPLEYLRSIGIGDEVIAAVRHAFLD